MVKPSSLGMFLSGILLLIFVIVILYNHFEGTLYFDTYQSLTLLLFFTIAVGVHGLALIGFEQYNTNMLM